MSTTLTNKQLADKISYLIDLNTATLCSLNAGAMTPHESAAHSVTMAANCELANLLDYFSEQAEAAEVSA